MLSSKYIHKDSSPPTLLPTCDKPVASLAWILKYQYLSSCFCSLCLHLVFWCIFYTAIGLMLLKYKLCYLTPSQTPSIGSCVISSESQNYYSGLDGWYSFTPTPIMSYIFPTQMLHWSTVASPLFFKPECPTPSSELLCLGFFSPGFLMPDWFPLHISPSLTSSTTYSNTILTTSPSSTTLP